MVELRNFEEKSFKCLISEKVFCWHTILTKYTVMHTGENPFQYILCEYIGMASNAETIKVGSYD